MIKQSQRRMEAGSDIREKLAFVRRRQKAKRDRRKQQIRELRELWKVEPYPDVREKLAFVKRILETERDKHARWKREGLCRKCGFRDPDFRVMKITDLCERCQVGEVIYRKRIERDRQHAEALMKYIKELVC